MNRKSPPTTAPKEARCPRFFSMLFGAFLGLGLVKFGNAVIMERFIERPTNSWEWLFNPWPFEVA